MIGLYVGCIVAIFVAEIAGGVFVFANRDDYMTELENKAKVYLEEKYQNNRSVVSDKAWNEAMKKVGSVLLIQAFF